MYEEEGFLLDKEAHPRSSGRVFQSAVATVLTGPVDVIAMAAILRLHPKPSP